MSSPRSPKAELSQEPEGGPAQEGPGGEGKVQEIVLPVVRRSVLTAGGPGQAVPDQVVRGLEGGLPLPEAVPVQKAADGGAGTGKGAPVMIKKEPGLLSRGPAEGPEPEGEDLIPEAGRIRSRKEDVPSPVHRIHPQPAVRVQHLGQPDACGGGIRIKGA